MAKLIPKVGSRGMGAECTEKCTRIPKGVIHVQASFNNTIVIYSVCTGRVISWSSASTCGFKGTRRGPFCFSNRSGNAIRARVDQGMQRAEVMIKGPGLERDASLRAIRRSVSTYGPECAAEKGILTRGHSRNKWSIVSALSPHLGQLVDSFMKVSKL
ncbi:30S ribosomal protein S11, chloroplastic-like [Gossypium arboreum]|uniref:30S ribosomal protein S11, chloroplastic-like n=1 Tax=Gossypium arboreum TaxID=29729 RepID=UPI0022F1686C|nr:30S ribosomal protein S11, chloroplastic-like [Gossypium arboreum]